MSRRRRKVKRAAKPAEAAKKDVKSASEASEIGNPVEVSGYELEPIQIRRWDSAATTRLNAAHWSRAHGQSINQDLASDLETLRARCNFEAANNPMVEGVIHTHATDIVGKDGPQLQVQSDSDIYNQAVEDAWRAVFDQPDPSSTIHGVEMLRLWVGQFWKSGEYVNEETSYPERGSATTLGITTYHPRRLETPPEQAHDPQVAFGIRFDGRDRPSQYYIRRTVDRGFGQFAAVVHEPVPADLIQHVFAPIEPDQIRGVPYLASCLNVIADIRQYDQYVMESVKNAAASSPYIWTDHVDLTFEDDPGDQRIQEPGVERKLGAGWQVKAVEATQPGTEYKTYKHERLRELGRPVGMPLMVVLTSSAESNFSSAHYDAQVYMRGIEWLQSMISRRSLSPYVRSIAREVSLVRRLEAPTKVTYKWTWPKPPYVNPKQMYDALRMQLEDGTATLPDVLGHYGRTEEETIATRKRTNELLEAAGLPPTPINYGGGTNPEIDQQEADAKTEMANKPVPAASPKPATTSAGRK